MARSSRCSSLSVRADIWQCQATVSPQRRKDAEKTQRKPKKAFKAGKLAAIEALDLQSSLRFLCVFASLRESVHLDLSTRLHLPARGITLIARGITVMPQDRRQFLATALTAAPLFVPRSAWGANDRLAYGLI